MPNLAMRQPGTMFVGDGLDLSWPIGGDREVIAFSDEDLEKSLRIRRRIAEGHIAIVDDKPTKKVEGDAREYKLLTGDEARRVFDEPAGPVTRVVYEPVAFEKHEVGAAQFEPLSERAIKAAEQAAEAAEEDHRAVIKRQVAAEKEAAKAATEAEEEEEDPIAARLARIDEVSAEAALAAEKDFMARETARQKLEDTSLPETEEPETTPEQDEAEKKAAATEKERQAKEKAAEKDKAAAEKKTTAAAKKSADTQAALSEPTPVEAPKPGQTPKSKGGQPKS